LTQAVDCCIVADVKSILSLVLALAAPLAAHHSFSAQFDATKQVTIEGTVTKIAWANPHVYFFVDVKGEDGTIATWACETNGPNGLIRQGWKRESMKVGDHVIVNAYLARDGTKTVDARAVTFADGRKVFTGSAGDSAPKAN